MEQSLTWVGSYWRQVLAKKKSSLSYLFMQVRDAFTFSFIINIFFVIVLFSSFIMSMLFFQQTLHTPILCVILCATIP